MLKSENCLGHNGAGSALFENKDGELLCVALVLGLLDRTKQNEENQRGLILKVSQRTKVSYPDCIGALHMQC